MPNRIRTALDRGLGRVRGFLVWSVRSYALFVVIGLAIGLTLAPMAIQYSAQPDGKVAVVSVDGSIDGQQAASYASMMTQARAQADAVVIVANSGGGSASASEAMYIQTKRTSEQIPVVTTIGGAAASGAYYTIAPSDRIYTKPASVVGSIGVRAPTPTDIEPQNLEGTTGPDKVSSFGGDRQFFHALETLKRAFLGAVVTHRGDRLEISENEVATARTWTGASAVQVGLADEIGDQQAAIEFAAAEAGLNNPEVVVLTPEERAPSFMLRSTYLASAADERQFTGGQQFAVSDPGGLPTFLMVPGGVVGTADEPLLSATTASQISESEEVMTDDTTTGEETARNATDTTDDQQALSRSGAQRFDAHASSLAGRPPTDLSSTVVRGEAT